jgi:hypothetical protein
VVVQEVDLVDVEDAAVGGGEQPGLVRRHAGRQRPLEVERADEAVLGGADRQLDEPRGRLDGAPWRLASGSRGRGAGRRRSGSPRRRRPAAAAPRARARPSTWRCPSRPARARPRRRARRR